MSLIEESKKLFFDMLNAKSTGVGMEVTKDSIETLKKIMGIIKEYELSVIKVVRLKEEIQLLESAHKANLIPQRFDETAGMHVDKLKMNSVDVLNELVKLRE